MMGECGRVRKMNKMSEILEFAWFGSKNLDFASAENQIRKWITLLGWDRFHPFCAAYRLPKNL